MICIIRWIWQKWNWGGLGLGPECRVDPANVTEARIPRNAPAPFNLGAREFTTLFQNGGIEVDA
jgi:cytochrome c peroxidase